MKNLELLEIHRKKVALLVALFVFLSIYAIIFTFQFWALYQKQKNDSKILQLKADKIEAVLEYYENLSNEWNINAHFLTKELITDTIIYTKSWAILENIHDFDRDIQDLEDDKIYTIGSSKYLKKTTDDYQFIVSVQSKEIQKSLWTILVIFMIVGPLLYSFLSWIMCKFMTRVYRPLRETITNLEAFTTNVNHEFKTTLTEIISSLELADITKDYESANQQSSAAAKRLNRILDSLWVLIHFSDSSYRKQKVNIIEILDESLSDYERKIREKSLSIKKLYNPDATIYKSLDPAPLILSFNNLLKNAIKFSKPWWEIEIDIGKNFFLIKDYGVWIEEENLDKIFDRYFRENYIGEGNGIGLSIIKRLSEIYNWDIQVKSEKDTFTEIKIVF